MKQITGHINPLVSVPFVTYFMVMHCYSIEFKVIQSHSIKCIIKITEIISVDTNIFSVISVCSSFSYRRIFFSGHILLIFCPMVVCTLCMLLMLFVTIKNF